MNPICEEEFSFCWSQPCSTLGDNCPSLRFDPNGCIYELTGCADGDPNCHGGNPSYGTCYYSYYGWEEP
jgi:hypothetical protein